MQENDLNRLAIGWLKRLGDRRGVDVRWNSRMRSLAGTAEFARRRVELNERLLKGRVRETVLTLAHEVCHLAAGARSGHGETWTQAMARLGFRPDSTHRLDVSHLVQQRRRWIWECARCREEIERSHRGVEHFRCLCGGRLQLVGPAPESVRRMRSVARVAPARAAEAARAASRPKKKKR